MRERRRNESVGVEFGHSLSTHAGEQQAVFDVLDGLGGSPIVNLFKDFRALCRDHRPTSTEKLFTGLNVMSYPAVQVVRSRDWVAMKPVSSRSSRGGRSHSASNISRRCWCASGRRSVSSIGKFHATD